MQPAFSLTLPNIQIKANSETSHKQAAVAGSQYDYNQKTIQQEGANTTSQFLQNQGAVQITSQSGNPDQLAIDLRGFGITGSQNSLMLIDGIPFTSSSLVGANLNSVLVDNIDNINLMPGSYGSLYGNQAVGGVLNITTATPGKKIARMRFGLGNRGQQLGGLFLSRRLSSGIGYSLGFQGYNTVGFQTNSARHNRTLNGKLDYIGNKGMISANIIRFRYHTLLPNSQILGQPTVNPKTGHYVNSDGDFMYLLAKYFLSPHWFWQGSLSENHTKSSSDTGKFQSLTHQQGWRLQNQLHYRQHSLFGVDILGNKYALLNQKQNKQVQALEADIYFHHNIHFGKQWNATLGARYARQHTQTNMPANAINQGHNEHALVAEQGITFQVTPNLMIYLRHDSNFRFPKSDERAWTINNINDLKTQKGESYELGTEWNIKSYQFKLSAYRLNLKHELAYDPTPTDDAPFGKISNLPPTQRYGLELSNKLALSSTLNAILQASIVDPKFSTGKYCNKIIPMVSPYHVSASLQYRNHHGWQGSITETYRSSFYAADDLSNKGNKFRGYFLTNLFVGKRINAFTLGLRVNNFFDKHYVRYADYEGSDLTLYYPADGLSVIATMTMDLKI